MVHLILSYLRQGTHLQLEAEPLLWITYSQNNPRPAHQNLLRAFFVLVWVFVLLLGFFCAEVTPK